MAIAIVALVLAVLSSCAGVFVGILAILKWIEWTGEKKQKD